MNPRRTLPSSSKASPQIWSSAQTAVYSSPSLTTIATEVSLPASTPPTQPYLSPPLRSGSILVSPPPTFEFPLHLTWPVLARLLPDGHADPSFTPVRFDRMPSNRKVEPVTEFE